MSFSISYRRPGEATKIRAHVAPTREIADAVVAYVKAKYGEEPESVTDIDHVRLDPGGGARLNPRVLTHTAPSGATYQVDHYHVQEVLAQLGEATLTTYGTPSDVYRLGCYYVSIILASDAESLKDWLTGLPKWTIEGANAPTSNRNSP
jgi:hypothetical protein